MARHFTKASSEKVVLSLGAMGFAFGPGTLAVLIRFTSLGGSGQEVMSLDVDGTNKWYFYIEGATNKLKLQLNAGQTTSTTTVTTAAWYLLAACKATGTSAVRFHIYDYAANTWTHENGGSLASSGVPTTSVILGSDNAGTAGYFLDGDIAMAGAWDVQLTDSQVEALPYTLTSWFAAAQPKGLWLLDQAATSTKVIDLSGGGANESSVTGTSVATVSVPVWNRGGTIGYRRQVVAVAADPAVGHWYQGFNSGGGGDASASPPQTATRPIPPTTYTPPDGTSISTSANLVSALQSTSPATFIVEDGVYTNTTKVSVRAAHQVYARHLGGAEIQFGLETGQFSDTTGALFRGLNFNVTDPAKTLLGSIIRLWASAGGGWQFLDCYFHGSDSINDAIGGLGTTNLEGLVIQRCEARNFHANGFRIDANSTTYVPTVPPLLEDIYTENCVYKTFAQNSNGTAESGLWLGCKATLNRLWCHQEKNYAVDGGRATQKAWQGLWLGTNVRDSVIQDVLVTGFIGYGSYGYGPINSDDSSELIVRRFETHYPVNVGFHLEWNNPNAAHHPNNQNVLVEDSYFETQSVGWNADAGTVHSTVRNTVFTGQLDAAINSYNPGSNMLYDVTDNDYSGIDAGAVEVGTTHAPDLPHWGHDLDGYGE